MGSNESISLLIEILYTRNGHFFIFTVFFMLLAVAIYVSLKKRNPVLTFSHLVLRFTPYLIPLFWFYGTVFNPPNNFTVAKEYGFIPFWLSHFYNVSDIKDHAIVFLLLLGFGCFLLFMSHKISRHYSWLKTNVWVTAIYASTVYLAAHALRYIPGTVMDAYISSFTHGLYVSGHFLTPIFMGALLMSIGVITAGVYENK